MATKDERDGATRRAFQSALEEAEQTVGEVVPTKVERDRGGWTTETLSAYHAEQAASQAVRIDPSSALRRKALPRVANSRYRPLRWRG